jgi:hydroxycarboxylate dehydrogenase B
VSELDPVRLPKAELAAFCRALLESGGATSGNAAIVVDHLIEADLMGLKSHGVMRVPQYLDEIDAGGIASKASPTVTRLAPGRALVDGGEGFGQVIGQAMAAVSVGLARENGVGFVTGCHMGHTGRIGAYAEAIARDGYLGVVVCSGPQSGHFVSPFGGLEGRLATNPIAYAFPVDGSEPVAADFSTSVVPEGVVRSLRNQGLTAPDGALRDPSGNPTSDPNVLYGSPRGTIQPLGGAFGYRGTALGILVELLATVVAGQEADNPHRMGSNLAMLAISLDEGFGGRAARMAAYIRSSPPIDPMRSVMMPGDREQEATRTGTEGILVDGPTWRAMVARAGTRIVVPMVLSDPPSP